MLIIKQKTMELITLLSILSSELIPFYPVLLLNWLVKKCNNVFCMSRFEDEAEARRSQLCSEFMTCLLICILLSVLGRAFQYKSPDDL